MIEKKLTIALAGQANVGKSVLFNQLTGLHQHIGNWPGKTVEKAEGTLKHEDYIIDIVDLPGIYSLTTYSIEEVISREYIVLEKPDMVINVVDSSILERNLFFTIQLLELETPLVMALNQIDMATKKGINVDYKKLGKILGIHVVPTVAPKGVGIHEVIHEAVNAVEKKAKPPTLKYGIEVETRVKKLADKIGKSQSDYPARWLAIKLLEGDEKVRKIFREIDNDILTLSENLCKEIEKIHGHSCSTVIALERYGIASRIAKEVQRLVEPKVSLTDRLHYLTTDWATGYPLLVLVLGSIFLFIFTFGNFMSEILASFFESIKSIFDTIIGTGLVSKFVVGGVLEGVFAGIAIVLPYIIPFYIILGILEDSGYLTRIAFMMDSLMHKIGLHGKAIVPIMLGYGCNVPGCLGCRILETDRERLLAAFVVTLVPCAATTVIILGLVGAFVGLTWALALYAVNLLVIFILGRIAFRVLPGEPTGLIMEMPSYRMPHLGTVLRQSWFRVEEFVKIAFPFIIFGSIMIKTLEILDLLEPISNIISPITVGWLGLPAIVGIPLVLGVIRKELTLIMLATMLGTENFAAALTPVQMIVFALVTMLYIPCISTIAALISEFGWKKASYITLFEIFFAIFIGGVAFRLLILI